MATITVISDSLRDCLIRSGGDEELCCPKCNTKTVSLLDVELVPDQPVRLSFCCANGHQFAIAFEPYSKGLEVWVEERADITGPYLPKSLAAKQADRRAVDDARAQLDAALAQQAKHYA